MLKISAVLLTTALFAGFLALDAPGLGVAASVAGADAAVVRVRTIAIRPSVFPTLVSTFEPSTNWQPRPNLRRNMSRVAALY